MVAAVRQPILRSLAESYLRSHETVTTNEDSDFVDAEYRHTAQSYGYTLAELQDMADIVYAEEVIGEALNRVM